MSNTSSSAIPSGIIPYLNEIAARLWSGHAAVMVGAGFSKNARPNGASCSGFPDWNQLGDVFYEKAYGNKPDTKRKYLNVLKLADEMQAALGRPALDQALRDTIPDSEYEPSRLHIKLLELPWVDVFTTNYDTLLERACTSISSKKYDIVVNKEDLVYSQKPRIIKLHGSFPSERPFIITEEDYRRYPKDFAPFVNTVQQSLLENTLLLVGFSGDDPNFLQWIGWIRDNLGNNNSPKIYLVGVLSLSVAQKKLLEQRNIVLVDMSGCGVGDDHYKGLERFIDYLVRRKSEDDGLVWPKDLGLTQPDISKDKISNAAEIVPAWRGQRISYPGWEIAPEDCRNVLWLLTKSWVGFVSKEDSLPGLLDLEFAFELNWRMERCLCPIPSARSEFLEVVLDKYLPLIDAPISAESHLLAKGLVGTEGLERRKIREMCMHILLSIMRFYREAGLSGKWRKADIKVESLREYLSPEQKANLYYERALYALFGLDTPELITRLTEWQSNESLPFWEAKRAALLAEIGQVNEAEQVLEKSLKNIRAKLNLKPITSDYTMVSQESFIMLLFRYVNDAAAFSLNNKPATADEEMLLKINLEQELRDENKSIQQEHISEKNTDNTGGLREIKRFNDEWGNLYQNKNGVRKCEWDRRLSIVRGMLREQEVEKNHDRWNSLKQYKCDPWGELRILESALERPPVERPSLTEKHEFDIGRVTRMVHYSDWNNEALTAYSFLRFCEDAGMPFKISNCTLGNKSAEGALSRISKHSPYWAMATMMRIGDSKVIDHIFNRESLSGIDVAIVDDLVNGYLDSLDKSVECVWPAACSCEDNFGAVLAKVIPEILSRLCCKCSLEPKKRLINYLLKIYNSDRRGKYGGIRHLTERLLGSFSIRQRFGLIPLLLDFPVLENLDWIDEREFINPFRFLGLETELIKGFKKRALSDDKINIFFEKALSDNAKTRKWATFTLVELYSLGFLERGQIDKLAEVLWARLDNYGLPTQTDYYKFAFIGLPHPDSISPASLLKKFIDSEPFHIQKNHTKNEIEITKGGIAICHEIIGANKHIKWSNEDAISILSRVIEWWDADKNYLKIAAPSPAFGSAADEFRARFSKLVDVVRLVVVPNLGQAAEAKHIEAVLRLIMELRNYGISALRLEAAYLSINPDLAGQVLDKIENNLTSSSREVVIDSLKSVLVVAGLFELDMELCNLSSPLRLLANMILWRRKTALPIALNTIKLLAERYPALLFGDLEKTILFALQNIAEDIRTSTCDFNFSERLTVRQEAACLAYTLFNIYTEQGRQIPKSILEWQKICRSDSEFAEIKNQWIDES